MSTTKQGLARSIRSSRAGQKVPSLRPVDCRVEKLTHGLWAGAHGFGLLAAARVDTPNSSR
jgi:hypothetical protein